MDCPVCFEATDAPHALPCGHLLCLACLRRLHSRATIRCPACRRLHRTNPKRCWRVYLPAPSKKRAPDDDPLPRSENEPDEIAIINRGTGRMRGSHHRAASSSSSSVPLFADSHELGDENAQQEEEDRQCAIRMQAEEDEEDRRWLAALAEDEEDDEDDEDSGGAAEGVAAPAANPVSVTTEASGVNGAPAGHGSHLLLSAQADTDQCQAREDDMARRDCLALLAEARRTQFQQMVKLRAAAEHARWVSTQAAPAVAPPAEKTERSLTGAVSSWLRGVLADPGGAQSALAEEQIAQSVALAEPSVRTVPLSPGVPAPLTAFTIQIPSGVRRHIVVELTSTVRHVMQRIQDYEGVPVEQQRLVWGGRPLEEKRCLREYGVPEGGIITMVTRTR